VTEKTVRGGKIVKINCPRGLKSVNKLSEGGNKIAKKYCPWGGGKIGCKNCLNALKLDKTV